MCRNCSNNLALKLKKEKEKLNRKKHERECTKSVCRKYENMCKYCIKIYVLYA
jgi:hypothetical protein